MIDTLIQNKLKELPKNIRNAIEVFDWSTEILHIAHDHHLQMDTVEAFQRETLLVIVGLTPAIDFEKNLVSRMGISQNLAERIVADANEHIFRPLQKIAFSHHEPEKEIIEHKKISTIMDEHGINLIDESTPTPRPKNELQDLADSLFKKPVKTQERETSKKELVQITNQSTQKPKKIEYNEPLQESDLTGIYEHRIDTSILEESSRDELFGIEKKLFNNTHISKTEKIDVSPNEIELIKENNEFLKHIGAS